MSAGLMRAPLYAGFESARLHWSGRDLLVDTGHTPEARMRAHYRHAISHGVTGFRDTLPARFCPEARYAAAREVAPDAPIIWDVVHFDDAPGIVEHARRVARILGPDDRVLAVNEPSVGPAVSGRTRNEATALAVRIMSEMLNQNPGLKFWTCDPVHQDLDEEWRATDTLVGLFPDHVEGVGINHYPHHAGAPLSRIIRSAADRYPGRAVAITETGLHDGHADNHRAGVRTKHEWLERVGHEIAHSGVPVAFACWYPWISMSWDDPANPWPNGWHHQPEPERA